MGKGDRRRHRNGGKKPPASDAPRYGKKETNEVTPSTGADIPVLDPAGIVPPDVRAREGIIGPEGFTIPASALGPPQNEAERASPALQAMRMMTEHNMTGDIRDDAPSQYEPVEAGLTVNPPPLIGPLGGRIYQDVAPFRAPNLSVPARHAFDPDVPAELREQLETPSTMEPDKANVRKTWTAGQVLEHHTWLTERFAHPTGAILDYVRYFVTDSYRKNPQRAQGMFYPADLRPLGDAEVPDPGTGVAQQICGVVSRGLRNSLTFEVTEEMVQVMRQVHDKTQENVAWLDEAELPCPSGFAWLDSPWPIIDAWANYIPIRALTWDLDYAWASMEKGQPRRTACVRIGLWTYMDDDVAYGRWDGQEHRAQATSDAMGELTFMHIALLPFGAEFEFGPGADAKKSGDSILGILHTLWMFLGMEIVSTEPAADVPRLARKRALKSLKHGEVKVVTLRKIRHVKSGDIVNPRDIDWSCRWVVQGHWRHIDRYEGERHRAIREVRRGEKYDTCAVCTSRGEEVRVTWIAPYMKGPDGAPLKSADKLVYRLSR